MLLYFLIFNLFTIQNTVEPHPVETLSYDVVYKNKTVGSLKATKQIKGSETVYKTSSTIELKIIKTFDIFYKFDVTVEDEVLEKAYVDILVNDKQHAKTSTEWHNNEYQITKDDKAVEAIKRNINYSTIFLYFDEPVNINSCYSEQDGTFNTIVSLGNNTYKKINAKGRENIYYYKNGALDKIVIDAGIIEFEIVLHK